MTHGLVLFYRRFKLLVAECVAGILGVVDLGPAAPSATSRNSVFSRCHKDSLPMVWTIRILYFCFTQMSFEVS